MPMYVNLDGHGPLHAQLTRALRSAILDGRLRAGAKLPPTREFAAELGLSRTTVLTAYEQLRVEGFLSARTGAGSYVQAIARPTPVAETPAPPMAPTRYVERMRAARTRPALPARSSLRYDLQYGAPLVNPRLTAAWGRELANAARYANTHYPPAQGLPELRAAIADYLARRRGVLADPERILIVNGTQQALALVARVLLDEGDRVVLEEPRYFGAYHAFKAHGAELVPVPVDIHGLVCEQLPAAPPKCIFVAPSHQFPRGKVMSLERRLALLRYAQATGSWIVEDDYDSEFRYDGPPLASLRALDEGDRVIYVGTFSKAVLGSLRLGYMLLPAALCEDFVRAKWIADMGTASIEQTAMANFMRNGGFERHLRQVARMLKQRRTALLQGLQRHAGTRILVENSQAGMHLVAWLPDLDHAQCAALIQHACSQGLGLYPIAPHYFQPPPQPGLLLGYAGVSVAELGEATALLGRCLRAFTPCGSPRSAARPASTVDA